MKFPLQLEVIDYQISFQLQVLESEFSKNLISGILSSGFLEPEFMSGAHITTQPKWEVLRMHLNNLFLTYPQNNLVDICKIHGYKLNTKLLKKVG